MKAEITTSQKFRKKVREEGERENGGDSQNVRKRLGRKDKGVRMEKTRGNKNNSQ